MNSRDQRFATVTCLAAGDDENALREQVWAALDSGDITLAEMREAVLQFAIYAGWPKGSRFSAVVEEWFRRSGRTDDPSPPPNPVTDRAALGQEAFRNLNCVPFVPPPGNPYTDAIVDFVYGEVWLRPGLGIRERRLITTVCALLSGVQMPIVSHVYAALKSRDLTFEEIDELARLVPGHEQVIAEQRRRVLAEWRDDG